MLKAAFCVHLADKYIKGDKLISLETRFNPDWAADRPEALPFIAARREDALALDNWFKERLPWPVERVLTTPLDHEYERLITEAAGSPGLLPVRPDGGLS